jgi:hypothetical protein
MSWGGTRRFSAAVALAVALALSLVLFGGVSAAADGTPEDLRSVLAPPPATDYIEASPRPDTLDGAFDAKGYADFVSAVDGDDASSLEGLLTGYGFSRGYGLTWIQRGTRYYMEEFVFEFRLATGAKFWLGEEKDGTSTMKEYRGELDGGTTIPGAWTGRVSTDGPYGAYRVGFVKGNDYYVISVDSTTTDVTDVALKQAQAQYDFAPGSTTPPGIISAAIKGNRNLTAVAWVVGGMITIILIGTVAILLLLARHRRPAAVIAQGTYSDVPMNATRSPDGAYWWDGVTWRPVVPPRSPY